MFKSQGRLPLVEVLMACSAGSRYEPPHLNGLAHLCEHVLFIGSCRHAGESYPDRLQRAGGLPVGSVSHERAIFSTTLPNDRLASAIEVEAARMSQNSLGLSSGELEIQKQILQRERRQKIDSHLQGLALERLHQCLFSAKHPYHRLPVGSAEGICAIESRDLEAFYRERYTVSQAVLALVGNFDQKDTKRQIEQLFAHLPATPAPSQQSPRLAGPPKELPIISGGASRPHIFLAYRLPGQGSQECFLASLLARGLARDRSNPIYKQIVSERKIASRVSFQVSAMRDASILVFQVIGVSGIPCRELKAALLSSLKRLRESPLSSAFVDRARNRAVKDFHTSEQWLSRVAERHASWEMDFGDAYKAYKEVDYLLSVKPEMVESFMQHFLISDRSALLSFAPDEQGG